MKNVTRGLIQGRCAHCGNPLLLLPSLGKKERLHFCDNGLCQPGYHGIMKSKKLTRANKPKVIDGSLNFKLFSSDADGLHSRRYIT